MMKRTRRKKDDDTIMKFSEERLQDFLMPGLRHAHTLQQLKNIIEYSPPGEYLNDIHCKRRRSPTKKSFSNDIIT